MSHWKTEYLSKIKGLRLMIILRNRSIKEYYDSVKNRKGSDKFAHVSKMRKLIRVIFTMLTERKEWKYVSPALTQSKISNMEA